MITQIKIVIPILLIALLLGLVYYDFTRRNTPEVSLQTVRSAGPGGVILISIDTLRADHLGTYGYSRETSPNLDNLASDGVVMEKAISTAPWTLASHASIFTCVPEEVHHMSFAGSVLPEHLSTIASRFRSAGYETAGWMNSTFLEQRTGLNRGFNIYSRVFGAAKVFPLVLQWLRQNYQKRFFLFIHVMDVHGPYKLAEGFYRSAPPSDQGIRDLEFLRKESYHKYQQLDRFGSLEDVVEGYDAGIRYTDAEIGKFLDGLKSLGLYKQSTLAVVSDHGESLFDHRVYVGHGIFLSDDELQVPLILKLPASKFRGTRITQQVSLLSVLPTLLDLKGITIPKGCGAPSLKPYLSGKIPMPSSPVYARSSNLNATSAVRTQNWKYVEPVRSKTEDIFRHLKPSDEATAAVLRERIIVQEQLYFLSSDPKELVNVAPNERTVASGFSEKVAAHRAYWDLLSQQLLTGVPQKIELDEKTREELRSLGYISE